MKRVNGWTVYGHPLFLDQLEKLTGVVEEIQRRDPQGWRSTANAKLLAALHKLVFEIVPQDPSRTEYRQGTTLGSSRKHWFRVKFANGRFRLFFRYDSTAKVIVFAWVNDQSTLRTYGAKSDAYAVFRKMLNAGNPPDDWRALLTTASDAQAVERLDRAGKAPD